MLYRIRSRALTNIIISIYFLFGFFGISYAKEPIYYEGENFILGVSQWFSSGKTSWDQFATETSSLQGITVGNETGTLETTSSQFTKTTYDNIESNVLEIAGELMMPEWFFIRGRFGLGDIEDTTLISNIQSTIQQTLTPTENTNSDTLIQINNNSESGLINSTTELNLNQDIKGDNLYYFDLDFGLTLWSSSKKGKSNIRAFTGFQRWEEEYILRLNTVTSCLSGDTFIQFCNFENFISNKLLFNSIKLGVEGKIAFNSFFLIRGTASYIPYSDIEYEEIGEANNITTNTTQKSEFGRDGSGTGYNFKIVADYEILPLLFLSVGYQFWRMEANDNVEGIPDSFPIGNLEIERQGFTLGASFRY